MTKKKVAAFFTAAALCGALAVGSSMAYLTDHDSVTNKFSVGKVDIVGHEPNYTPDNDGKTNNIVPTQVIKKDPQIENVGKNDAYVYLDVSIPIYISIIFSNIFDLRVFFDYLGRNNIVGFSIIIRCVVRLMANDVYFTYRKFVGYRIMICQICHG